MSHAQQAQNSSVCFVRAYAKINLALEVLGRRTDGYHELLTVMQTIDLYDTLCLTATSDDEVRLICTHPDLSNEENLAFRAAQLVRQRLALKQGLLIELDKRIPIMAGVGGGSSDAAAVLFALHQWWHLHVSPAELLAMAATLGSDVPFFLKGGLALCAGRGEQVTPLAPLWPVSMRWLLLLKPAIAVSTAAVFRDLSARDYSDGRHSQAVYVALQAGREPVPENLYNSLERSVLERHPQITKAREDLLTAGAAFVRLSGSGPMLFAPFAELAKARRVQERLQTQGYEVYLSRAVHPNAGVVSQF